MGRMNEGCLERDTNGEPSKIELNKVKGSVNWNGENGV